MNILLEQLQKNNAFNYLSRCISDSKTPVVAGGVIDTQKAHIIAGLCEKGGSAMVVTSSELKAQELYKDLTYFIKGRVCLYPSKDVIFYSADVKSNDIIKRRFEIIARLIKNEPIIIVLSVEALFDRLVPLEEFKSFIVELRAGEECNIGELAKKLVFMGYERCDMVEAQGQFAIRGNIMDIFSTNNETAIRLELWGDEIDSIRVLDSNSQRSIENISNVSIFPMRELVYTQDKVDNAIKSLEAEIKSVKNPSDRLREIISENIELLKENGTFFGVDRYICHFYKETESLINYMNEGSMIFVDEPERVRQHADFVFDEFKTSIYNRIEAGYMLPSQINMIYTYDDITAGISRTRAVLFTSFIHNIKDFKPKEMVSFQVKASQVFKNNFQLLAEDLAYMCKNNYTVFFLAGGQTRCERIHKELTEKEIPNKIADGLTHYNKGAVYILKGNLTHGFEYVEDKIAVITDTDLFGDEKKKRGRIKGKKNKDAIIQDFSQLKIGDYVVHENHGIGVFKGIEQRYVDGVSKDYIKIGYADDSNLYITINQIDMVQKYIGGDNAKPKLSKLGGAAWKKAKTKARQAALIMAEDLLKLYAKRESVVGCKYGKDTVWQREFEEAFPYTETDDQLNAIADVKEDMEKGKVMDRLICGDVGFGKTEVALRAAFKTVQEGKQVAYLVPTTILARQHFMTFTQRMSDYPVKVDLLNRFRTPKEQKETLKGLENGMVDVVIGTHRLLSKDVKFRDLGLVIVDEEQRFGVGHKEKLKQLTENVNILTLTATPIPRTLHMSLTGIRDMSILTEPPEERIPVQTYVMEYNPEFVKDAIHRELARNGQVYYLHNRVNNIADVALKVQKLVPEANVAFAHGQMSERELEGVMLDFMDGLIDVLVCTTIIETGLDISNVNTIIIQDADCMGLSQLYQLRGRVGRSNRTSFAYLMYKRDKVLQEVSEKRLQTIREFTQFGSGFKVAMRDLEIRGAGNLLGAQQHGHMDSIGYELYCKILDEAVRQLKGEEVTETFETLMDINVNAFIPEKYISSEMQKLEMYKKISVINSIEDFYDVQEELEDRFGDIPKPVQNLLDVAYIKAEAHALGVVAVTQRGENVVLSFKQDSPINIDNMVELIKQSKGKVMFNGNNANPYLTLNNVSSNGMLDEIKDLVLKLKGDRAK